MREVEEGAPGLEGGVGEQAAPQRLDEALSAQSDADLDEATVKVQQELAALGVVRLEVDPIKGAMIDALADLLIDAGLVTQEQLNHRMRVRFLIELRRGLAQMRRQQLAGRSSERGIVRPIRPH